MRHVRGKLALAALALHLLLTHGAAAAATAAAQSSGGPGSLHVVYSAKCRPYMDGQVHMRSVRCSAFFSGAVCHAVARLRHAAAATPTSPTDAGNHGLILCAQGRPDGAHHPAAHLLTRGPGCLSKCGHRADARGAEVWPLRGGAAERRLPVSRPAPTLSLPPLQLDQQPAQPRILPGLKQALQHLALAHRGAPGRGWPPHAPWRIPTG